MTKTYKVKVFSDNGTLIIDKEIRADKIHTGSGIVYLTKDDEDMFVGPVSNTVIEKI